VISTVKESDPPRSHENLLTHQYWQEDHARHPHKSITPGTRPRGVDGNRRPRRGLDARRRSVRASKKSSHRWGGVRGGRDRLRRTGGPGSSHAGGGRRHAGGTGPIHHLHRRVGERAARHHHRGAVRGRWARGRPPRGRDHGGVSRSGRQWIRAGRANGRRHYQGGRAVDGQPVARRRGDAAPG